MFLITSSGIVIFGVRERERERIECNSLFHINAFVLLKHKMGTLYIPSALCYIAMEFKLLIKIPKQFYINSYNY